MAASEIDHAQARALRDLAGFVEKGECYRNSVLALAFLPKTALLYYVEGWLLLEEGTYPIEHGWLELDGCVIDVTLEDEKADQYISVLRYSEEAIHRLLRYRRRIPFFQRTAKARKAMLKVFDQLPIDHDHAVLMATFGYALTGKSSLILEERLRDE